jgi:hypothetical protein
MTTTTSKKSLIEMAETMHVKDTITFQINSEVSSNLIHLVPQS